jgi:hypothetical protein
MKQLILSLLLTLCATDLVHAQNDQDNAKSFFWRQCTENVIMLYLEPKPLEELVGSDFAVKLYDGKAWVMIVMQDCQNNFFDGEDVGPAKEVHMWVSVENHDDNEVIPVFGAQKTLNTMSWFYLFNGSTNLKARICYGKAGILSKPIENLSLSLTSSELNGKLAISPGISLEWKAVPKEPVANKIGVNFNIFSRDSIGNGVQSKVQALLMVKSWFAPGTLEVAGGIGPGKLVKPGTYQVFINSYNPILIRAMLGVTPSK